MNESLTFSFHPKAEKEFLDSLTWYADNASIELASRFRQQIRTSISIVCESPHSWKEVKDTVCRRYLVKGFPYQLIYRIQEEKKNILIIAVAHTKRHPDYWKNRT